MVLRILVVLLFIACCVLAQSDSGQRLKADVQFLADDLLQGRLTPSEGLNIAALYLSNQLAAYGWQPAGNSGFLQPFEVEGYKPDESQIRIAINGVELKPGEYIFVPLGMDPRKTPVTYPLVFLGQGVFEPDNNIDDFKNVDLAGKAGIALFGAPWKLDPHAIHSCDRAVGKSVQVCVRNGSLLLYVTEELDTPADREIGAEIPVLREFSHVPLAFLADGSSQKTMSLPPILMMSSKVFDKILAGVSGNDYAAWQKKFSTKKRPASFALKAEITISIKARMTRENTQNVVAVKAGQDPALGQEWLVLSAHYDHVGRQPAAEGKDGIYNGADDNASGTAAILETARLLSQDTSLRRGIIVLFCCGEENGLLGSAYFARHPCAPLQQIVLDLNADMVGRSSGKLNCINTGCDELYQQCRQIGQRLGVQAMPDPYPTWRLAYFIDSYNFVRYNIPFLQFMTDFHADYHQPRDEANLINYDQLVLITQVIHEMAVHYANVPTGPVLNMPPWFMLPNE